MPIIAIANFGAYREPTRPRPNAHHHLSILEIVMEAPAVALPLAQPHNHAGMVVVATAWLAFCVVAAIHLVAPGNAMAQEQAVKFARECAVKEVAAITAIEDHGDAEDLPASRLGEAGQTMMDARSACYQGRVGEALALYDRVIALGPVASLAEQGR
jgi:hypothetical protein